MNNEQIIAEIAEEMYGEDAVMEMIEQGEEIPLHTLKGWQLRHFQVKKGEHGYQTRLWKKKKRKKDQPEDENGQEMPADRDFYLTKAFLFRRDQVEPMAAKGT